jgi:dephospho-CoA kinase
VQLLGLTGGIGSGKSTVSALLAARGAEIVDADLVAREVVAPDGVAYQPLVDRFGPAVLRPDRTLDRPALAGLVFADAEARRDLDAITHPAIVGVMAERIADHAGTDHVVVLDIPLLIEKGQAGVEAIIVVDCPEELAIDRLVTHRGFDPADARRRIAAQISYESRLALADIVVDNSGSATDLEREVERLWQWIESRNQ